MKQQTTILVANHRFLIVNFSFPSRIHNYVEFATKIAISKTLSRVVDHVPRYYTKRLPANAQLLQVPRDSIPIVPPVVRHTPEQLPPPPPPQQQQVEQTSIKHLEKEEDGGYQSLQQPVSTWPSQVGCCMLSLKRYKTHLKWLSLFLNPLSVR